MTADLTGAWIDTHPTLPTDVMRCGHPTTARRRVPEYRGRGFECVTCKSERRHG